MIDVPEDIRELFLAAGWRPASPASGAAIPDQIIHEFGGLHVGRCGPGLECAASDIRFLAVAAPGKTVAVEKWVHELGPLIAVADAHHDHIVVFVSERGEYYFLTDPDEKLYSAGSNFGEAMRKLLLGLNYGSAVEPNKRLQPIARETRSG